MLFTLNGFYPNRIPFIHKGKKVVFHAHRWSKTLVKRTRGSFVISLCSFSDNSGCFEQTKWRKIKFGNIIVGVGNFKSLESSVIVFGGGFQKVCSVQPLFGINGE